MVRAMRPGSTRTLKATCAPYGTSATVHPETPMNTSPIARRSIKVLRGLFRFAVILLTFVATAWILVPGAPDVELAISNFLASKDPRTLIPIIPRTLACATALVAAFSFFRRHASRTDHGLTAIADLGRNVDATTRTVGELQESLHSRTSPVKLHGPTAAYTGLMTLLKKRSADIEAIHSTVVQARAQPLADYEEFFPKLYAIFDAPNLNPRVENLIVIPPDTDELTLRQLFDRTQGFLWEPNRFHNFRNQVLRYHWVFVAELALPYVNFTHIMYRGGSSEVFFGWYRSQLVDDTEGTKASAIPEINARSSDPVTCALFTSLFDLTALQAPARGSASRVVLIDTNLATEAADAAYGKLRRAFADFKASLARASDAR